MNLLRMIVAILLMSLVSAGSVVKADPKPVEAAAGGAAEAVATPDSLSAAPDSLATEPDSPTEVSPTVPAPVPYGVGERLVFSIDYGPINAGEGVLWVKELTETDGHLCYEIESRALSNRFFSAFYKVRDKVYSHIDVYTLASRFFAKRIREGTYKKSIEYRIDHADSLVRYADGREFETTPGTHDILSAFYYTRGQELVPGQDIWMTAHSNRRTYDLQVIVHRKEHVKVPAGEFDCIVVEPKLIGDGLFKQEGAITIWLTDDEHRLPVLLKSKVKVGSIDATLKEYEIGRAVDTGRE